MEDSFKNQHDETSAEQLTSAPLQSAPLQSAPLQTAPLESGDSIVNVRTAINEEPANSVSDESRGEAVVATVAYLSLGSNIGDRLANLREACARLERHANLVIERKSRIYETQSADSGGDAPFLNAAICILWSGSASSLLRCTQSVEERMGRPKPPRQGPRLIDIDILLFGDLVIATPQLTVPHPRMTQRAFVLRPLSDVVAGGWMREFALGKL